MRHYDILKAKAGLPLSNFYEMIFAKQLSEKIKTLTGVLPLTFSTNGNKLRDWSISGNNKIGKNLVSLANFVDINANNVVMTADKTAGTISVYTTDTPTASTQQSCGTFSVSESGNYILSGVPSTAPNVSLQCYVWDETNSRRARAWDKTSASEAATRTTQEAQVYLDKDCTYHVNVHVQTTYGTQTTPVIVSPMIRSANTSSDFEPYQIGVGQRTKNLLQITTGTITNHGVKFTFDKETGIVVANGKATGGQGKYAFYIEPTETLNLYLSGCPEGGSLSTYDVYPWDATAGARPKKWDGTTSQTASDCGTGGLEVQAAAGHRLSATIRIEEGYTANNLVFKPMYRPANTSAEFITYGYEIPLTILQAGQTTKSYDIFIGSEPLTEGQSVSDTQTIEVFEGENTIDTTLYNKPEMSITYKEV